jgi:RNA polymerase sigma-70 factor (ECF subfamily)
MDFAECYRRYADMVYQLCYICLHNRTESEDAAQDVFLKLMAAEKAFNDEEHRKAWLIVTARNHCVNLLGHWWKSRRTDLASLPEIPCPDRAEQAEVTELLLALPEKYKTALYLYYYQGYSVREIAEMLRRKESTIQTRLARGRVLLKEKFK